MRTASPQQLARKQSHRPRAVTVFAAAFVAGAAAAVGVNRALDVRLAQAKPRVESEAIFVALRSLSQGTPVTVWDVALRDWPKAMLPASALRAHDSFTGQILKHPLREGQPLLAIQLMPPAGETSGPGDTQPTPPPAAYTQVSAPVKPQAEADLWASAEPAAAPPAAPSAPAESRPVKPAAAQPAPAAASNTSAAEGAVAWPQPVVAPAPAVAPLDATATAPAVASSAESQPEASSTAVAQPDAQRPASSDQPADDQLVAGQARQPSQAPASTRAGSDTPETKATPHPESVAPAPVAAVVAPLTVDSGEVPPVAQPAAEAETVPQLPTVVADIVAPEPVAEPVSVVAESPAAPAPQPVAEVAVRPLPRYLVVPENIAVQADRSFAIPTTAVPPAQSQRPVSGAAGVQQLPPTAGSTVAAPRNRQAGPPAQQRQAVGQEPRQPQQRQGRQPSPAPGAGTGAGSGPPSQPRLGAAMFPNISAGIDAIEGEWGRMRRDRTAIEGQPQPQQRPVTAR